MRIFLNGHPKNFRIPYLDPTTNRVRRYFPDFFIKYKDKNNNIRRSVIEVKPMRETLQPKATKGKSRKTMINESMTYVKNQAKWKAAREFCEDRKLEFKIMTEKRIRNPMSILRTILDRVENSSK